MNNLAPIVLFVYNRPWHTEQTLNALMQNEQASESTLYIYCDGVKENSTEDQRQKIIDVRNIIKTKKWCKEVYIIESEFNKGLANSIIQGVSEVLSKHAKVIVLEDDIVTSPYFLEYMNNSLNIYENEDDVISISGYIYPIKTSLPNTFFIKGADCWGWATWKRGWDLFEINGQKLLFEIKKNNLTHIFDFDDSYPYTKMLVDQIEGKNDSWAIRWYASAFIKNKLTLYPGYSFVSNIGFDGSGVHCGNNYSHNDIFKVSKMRVKKNQIFENSRARNKIVHYFRYKNNNLISIMYCIIKKNLILVLRSINGKNTKNIIKRFIPPILIDLFLKLTRRNTKSQYGWFGNYSSWEEASLLCEGYDSEIILEKVKSSLLKIRNSEAVYERDSVLFDQIQYSWVLLATLLKIGVENRKLHIVDFGGSLGSTYFQNKDFFTVIDDIQWNIVEQRHFVDVGKAEFEDDHLKFYYSIDECLEQNQCDVLLLSSVLQYLKSPLTYIEQILTKNFKHIIIDRTAFTYLAQSFITVQRVPPEIYSASYPCWFFNEDSLLEIFQKKYDLLYSFNALDSSNLPDTYFKGFVFKRKVC